MTSPITSILAATDFSPLATHAVHYAHGLASRLGASLCVIHVCEDPLAIAPWIHGHTGLLPEWRDQLQKRAQWRLLALTATLEGVAVTTAVVLNTSPARAIVETARQRDDSLIVIGTHGRRGLAHLVLGSVAERVVRTAHCPVLTIREPKEPVLASSEDAAAMAALGRLRRASLTM